MFTIPFHRNDHFVPKTIPDNDSAAAPVSCELFMAAGPDHARLKSLMQATAGLTTSLVQWSPEMQRAVTEGLQRSSELFVATIGAIRNLNAPAILCRRVQLLVDQKLKDDDPVAIDTGVKFSRVAPYMPILALELAFAIAQLTNEQQVDARFFDWPSGSRATAAPPSGTAPAAQTASAVDATAASSTPTDAPPPIT